MKQNRLNLAISGFTIVELLVGVLISSIFLLAVTRIFSESAGTYEKNTEELTLLETTRFALKDLTADLKRAGYMGCVSTGLYEDEIDNTERVKNSLSGPDSAGLYGPNGMQFRYAVYGVDNGDTNSDVLNIVYSRDLEVRALGLESVVTLTGNDRIILDKGSERSEVREAGNLLLISDCASAHPFVLSQYIDNFANDDNKYPVPPEGFSQLVVNETAINGFQNVQTLQDFSDQASGGAAYVSELSHITYQVGPSKIDSDKNYNSLFRLVNGEAQSDSNELISNVVNFQVKYGVRVNAANSNDGLPDQFIDANGNFDNTPSAVLIELTLDREGADEVIRTTVNLRNRGL
jgi:type IV pilus assembly protein PilW